MRSFDLFAVSTRRCSILVVVGALLLTACPLPQTIDAEIYCGNGVVEAEEACDDGDAEDTDDCLSSCVLASCGDGFVHAESEACDDGNAEDTDDCLSACVLARCGDGVVHAENEACDDGNEDNTDACLDDCRAASCGDGFLQDAAEQCDDGNTDSSDDCNENCETARCGDGFVWAGEEACDDGNTDDGDDCSDACEDQSHLVNNFSGQEGPVIGEGWRQCAGYLDRRDREDIPQEWGSACALEGMGKVRLYCGASALQSKFIEVNRNVFRDGLGAGINAGTPARDLITRSSWGTGNNIDMSNFIWADGRPSHPHAGKSHWGSDGSSCAWRIERRLIVNGSGCSYEAADCFGQNPDNRYLWVYVKP